MAPSDGSMNADANPPVHPGRRQRFGLRFGAVFVFGIELSGYSDALFFGHACWDFGSVINSHSNIRRKGPGFRRFGTSTHGSAHQGVASGQLAKRNQPTDAIQRKAATTSCRGVLAFPAEHGKWHGTRFIFFKTATYWNGLMKRL